MVTGYVLNLCGDGLYHSPDMYSDLFRIKKISSLLAETVLLPPERSKNWEIDTDSGGQNDDFRPLTYTLGGRGTGCRDKYGTSQDPS